MTLTFPPEFQNIFDSDTITFPAQLNGKRIGCRVSYELLFDRFKSGGPEPEKMVAAFQENREDIEQLVRTAIGDRQGVTEVRITTKGVQVI